MCPSKRMRVKQGGEKTPYTLFFGNCAAKICYYIPQSVDCRAFGLLDWLCLRALWRSICDDEARRKYWLGVSNILN